MEKDKLLSKIDNAFSEHVKGIMDMAVEESIEEAIKLANASAITFAKLGCQLRNELTTALKKQGMN